MTVVDGNAAELLRARLREIVLEENGEIIEDESNLKSERKGDSGNNHSSHKYRSAKLTVLWRRRFFEIQVQTLCDWVNSMMCTDDRNHAIYRLKQCLGVYFPLLFPKLYGFDWSEEGVRRDLLNWRVANLGLIAEVTR